MLQHLKGGLALSTFQAVGKKGGFCSIWLEVLVGSLHSWAIGRGLWHCHTWPERLHISPTVGQSAKGVEHCCTRLEIPQGSWQRGLGSAAPGPTW